MLERVTVEADAAVGSDGAAVIRAALADVLAFRDATLDPRDTRLFHPARTIRIVFADAGVTSMHALAAAAWVDTSDVELTPAPPPAFAGFVQQVPAAPPGADDELLEEIVIAD